MNIENRGFCALFLWFDQLMFIHPDLPWLVTVICRLPIPQLSLFGSEAQNQCVETCYNPKNFNVEKIRHMIIFWK